MDLDLYSAGVLVFKAHWPLLGHGHTSNFLHLLMIHLYLIHELSVTSYRFHLCNLNIT